MRAFDGHRLHDLSRPAPPLAGGEVVSMHGLCADDDPPSDGPNKDSVWEEF
jgi:hypothetical protein